MIIDAPGFAVACDFCGDCGPVRGNENAALRAALAIRWTRVLKEGIDDVLHICPACYQTEPNITQVAGVFPNTSGGDAKAAGTIRNEEV